MFQRSANVPSSFLRWSVGAHRPSRRIVSVVQDELPVIVEPWRRAARARAKFLNVEQHRHMTAPPRLLTKRPSRILALFRRGCRAGEPLQEDANSQGERMRSPAAWLGSLASTLGAEEQI